MELDKAIAVNIVQRLKHHGVQILTGGSGSICFFVPSPGSDYRSPHDSEYAQGLQDGAIRELQQLIRSLPALKQAVLEETAKPCTMIQPLDESE